MGKAEWQSLLPSEIAFWDAVISGRFHRQDFVEAFKRRAAGEYPFPHHLARYVARRDTGRLRILDVGAGPHTVIGPMLNGHRLDITAVDPLADEYNGLMEKYGVTPTIPTRRGEGEGLTPQLFPQNSFDLVYSRNALDHSYDPWLAIQQMIDVCVPGGTVFFEGSVNEGLKQDFKGLHQWNFMPADGDLVIWNKECGRLASKVLTKVAHLVAADDRWYRCAIVKAF